MLAQLWTSIQPTLHSCPPHALSLCLNSLAKLGWRPRDAYQLVSCIWCEVVWCVHEVAVVLRRDGDEAPSTQLLSAAVYQAQLGHHNRAFSPLQSFTSTKVEVASGLAGWQVDRAVCGWGGVCYAF